VNKMPTKSGKYVYLEDGSNAEQVYVANPGDTNSIIPIDIQSRYAQTIQTHNAVSVGSSNGYSDSSWIDADGFDKIAITMKNDAGTSSYVDIHWSHDGANRIGIEFGVIPSNVNAEKSAITDIKARYVRVRVVNADTIAHTMTAYAYLKA
jgi:hypothetical protein